MMPKTAGIESSSTRRWSGTGTASDPNSSTNTKVLSTLRAFSSR